MEKNIEKTKEEIKEINRHEKVLKQISDAKIKKQLPSISFNTLFNEIYKVNLSHKIDIDKMQYKGVIDAIIESGSYKDNRVKSAYFNAILKRYDETPAYILERLYAETFLTDRFKNLFDELVLKLIRTREIEDEEKDRLHYQTMKDINNCFEVKKLPKVGLSELNQKLLSAVNKNGYKEKFKTGDIKLITSYYLNEAVDEEGLKQILNRFLDDYELPARDKVIMRERIIYALTNDKSLEYLAEEIRTKEARKLKIYKMDHDETMDLIKDAKRIAMLPPNVSSSALTSYLNGNTTIYTNDDRITNEDLKELTDLLLKGYKWEFDVVKNEVKRIADLRYPDKDDAYPLLYNKLSALPKTYYYVEEINYAQKRIVEFIAAGNSQVNMVYIYNENSPMEGGNFYNACTYPGELKRSFEEYSQGLTNVDAIIYKIQQENPLFKTVGGIILNRDETIGDIHVFKPNDGLVGVSVEQKEKIDQIDDLDKQIELKKKELESLNDQVSYKQQELDSTASRLQELLASYEEKANSLHCEFMNNLYNIKDYLGMNVPEEEKGISRTKKEN